jgi:coxsackievirus/adenovirus receptor
MKAFLFSTIFLTGISLQCQLGNQPVCGSDNVTYRNMCELNKSFAVYQHPGRCVLVASADNPENLVANCTEDFVPVCGEDGVTYGNECRMKFRGINKSHDGVCGVKNFDQSIFSGKVCNCSYEWHPVCTKNSKVNFENLCFVRCIHQLEGSFDSCTAPCNCDTKYDPVCSVKGITFDNQCQLECANSVKGLNGECESILYDCDSGCSKVFAPICGVDGKTYRNKCFASCKKIEVAKDGICDTDSKDPTKKKSLGLESSSKSIDALCDRCSRQIKISPVCSEDGVTYENECQCQCQNGGVCPKYADGPCPSRNMFEDKCNHCNTYPKEPVCGNNYRTYDNLCYLECNRVALYKRGSCDSFAPKAQTSFDMRSNNFAQMTPKVPTVEKLKMQAQKLIQEVSIASAKGQEINPALISAMMSIIEALKAAKAH